MTAEVAEDDTGRFTKSARAMRAPKAPPVTALDAAG